MGCGAKGLLLLYKMSKGNNNGAGQMNTEIKPCKIHNTLPEWVDVEYPREFNMLANYNGEKTYRSLQCKQCKMEADKKKYFPEEVIEEWNNRQSK